MVWNSDRCLEDLSKVTIIQLDQQLLPNEDSDIAEEVASILKGKELKYYLMQKQSRSKHPKMERLY